jgi:peptide-methionine (S)-S-oxide reductase
MRSIASRSLALGSVLTALLVGCGPQAQATGPKLLPDPTTKPRIAPGDKTLIFGGGCFWCVEAVFEMFKGVKSAESGYAGGDEPNPTYDLLMSKGTRHAEVVKVTYDPNVISAREILNIFLTTHDPTTLNRQGNDVGTQYRSVIFYRDDAEKKLAQAAIDEVTKAKIWSQPIVTTLEPLKNYGRAEEYHQDYFAKFERASDDERSRMNGGYCKFIIEPKVRKYREKFAGKLRKN